MRRVRLTRVLVVLAALAAVLCSCGPAGLDFFGLSADDDFLAAKEILEGQGWRLDGREYDPFVLQDEDFTGFYTFYPKTELLARLKADLDQVSQGQGGNYRYIEPTFINSYIFYSDARGELGMGFSALSGRPLYAYYYTDDVTGLLEQYRKRFPDAEQVFPAKKPGDMEYHYFEVGPDLLILEKNPEGPGGGGVCYYADNVSDFYDALGKELAAHPRTALHGPEADEPEGEEPPAGRDLDAPDGSDQAEHEAAAPDQTPGDASPRPDNPKE